MTIVYFDSSAFVKLLVEEDGSDIAADLWNGCDTATSSRLAYAEVYAALAAVGRDHRLAEEDLQRAEQEWAVFWAAVRPVELTPLVAEHAAELVKSHRLRGADGVHLASALALAELNPIFAVWDMRSRSGAISAGMRVAPASDLKAA